MRAPLGLVLLTLLATTGCAVTTQTFEGATRERVHLYRLPVSNVYAIEGREGTVIVDSGDPGQEGDVLGALARTSVRRRSVRLLVLTHAHADHAGAARALAASLRVPIALQRADASTAEAGRNPPLHPTGLTAELLAGFLTQEYPAFAPTLAFDDCLDLRPYGVDGVVRSAPGHTPGSSVVLLASGDAIVGDLVLGGYLGGLFASDVPTEHYFQAHPARIRAILEWLLAQGVERLFLGHGGPVTADAVRTALDGGDLGEGPPDRSFAPPPCAPDAPETPSAE